MKIFVCTSCSLGQNGFLETVSSAFDNVSVEGIECMSGCSNDQTIAFRAEGKTAYLFGPVDVDDLPELKNFARLYEASSDGTFPDARVLGDLRGKALARIPG